MEDVTFPLNPKVIARFQQEDNELKKQARSNPDVYSKVELEGVELIAKDKKVVVPEPLQERLIDCYHELLQHPGMTRMEATIRHVFTWRGLRTQVEEYCKTCRICQLTKKQRKKYGHLPPKAAEFTSWK